MSGSKVIRVRLEAHEIKYANHVAALVVRNYEKLKRVNFNDYIGKRSNLEVAQIGLQGEMAFAKAYGLYCGAKIFTIKDFKYAVHPTDVCGLEIKTILYRDGWLPISRDSKAIHVLVLGHMSPMFYVRGYISAEEARAQGELSDRGGKLAVRQLTVDQRHLYPIEGLVPHLIKNISDSIDNISYTNLNGEL